MPMLGEMPKRREANVEHASYLLGEQAAQAIRAVVEAELPFPRPAPRSLTFVQRIRGLRYRSVGWLHDAMFGSDYCHGGEDY